MNEKRYNILVDRDPEMDYERAKAFRSTLNLVLVPVLNRLPPTLLPLMVKTHRSAEKVVEHKTEHAALEVFYQHGKTYRSRNPLERIARYVWFGLNNSMAVRNRLKIVRREVYNEMARTLQRKSSVLILSVAAGSARAVLEAIQTLMTEFPDNEIHAVFLDKNPAAMTYSRYLAKALGVDYAPNVQLTWVTDTVGTFFTTSDVKFDIVEMVGLMDYFNDEKAVKAFAHIYDALNPGGLLVTANVQDNRERKFVTDFVGWNMIYRTPGDLLDLLVQAKFQSGHIYAFCEPLEIHTVACARKARI